MKTALGLVAALGLALAFTVGVPGQSSDVGALKKEV
jgi:hypothetical protein